MDRFGFKAPSKVVFGKGTEAEVGKLCKEAGAKKVMVHFGGSSAKKSGLLDRVCASLKAEGLEYVLLGGVVANPLLSKVYEGIKLGKKEGVDFILAVGGGSVIDSAKAIGYGMANEGDVWDYYAKKKNITGKTPIGCILTMAAAGSEMSNASVITKDEGMLKRGLSTEYAYCVFSILNPELTYTVPNYQTASGCTDIMVHTLERYFVNAETKPLAITDMIAAQLLKNVMRNCRIALKNPTDYDARAEIMWCSTLSHNDTTGDRSFGDWACHQLEHELSGMFGIAHGAGLAAIWGTWARYVMDANLERFCKLAVDVFDIPFNYADPKATALEGVKAMESFFRHIGMPTNIHDLIGKELTDVEIKELAYKCSFMNTRTVGKVKTLDIQDMENIYRLAK